MCVYGACNSAGVEKERFVKFTTKLCYRFFLVKKKEPKATYVAIRMKNRRPVKNKPLGRC